VLSDDRSHSSGRDNRNRLDRNPSETTGLVGHSTSPEIRIVDSGGQSLAAEAVGEVWLHGPTVVRGYLGDPAITRRISPTAGYAPAIWGHYRWPAT